MTKRITDSEEVKSFINVANKYCNLIEERDKYTEVEIYQVAYQLLPQLCLYAMQLPEIDRCPYYEERISHSVWQKLYEQLKQKLKQSSKGYHEIYDPWDPNNTRPVVASLSDDLADIFSDIFPGLRDFDASSAALRRGIVWGWKFSYEFHWGDHATMAFRSIHWLLYDKITDVDGDYIGLKRISDK